MADQTAVAQQCSLNTFKEVLAAAYQTVTASNEGIFTVPKDGKYLLHIIDATGGAVVTIKHGDGIKGNQGDLVSSALTQNLNNFVVLESSRFKNLSGTDIGKIRITTTANISVGLIALP